MADTSNNVSVIGVGRLGLCFALVLERKAGFNIVGVDISPQYVEALNNKSFKSLEPSVSEYLVNSENFRASSSLDEAIAFSDLLWLLVDTPTGVGRSAYDHSKVSRVLEQLNERKLKNKHIVIGCTVLPGYISNVGRYLLSDCENVTLSYNPEFIAQGDIINGLLAPDLVLIGEGSEEAGNRIEQVYRRFVPNAKYCRMNAESGEITKLAINCMVTSKITFANLIGDIADRTPNSDKYKILDAIGSDARIGSKYLKPGFGFGGPCFPRDNRALGFYAESLGLDPVPTRATDQYNIMHAKYMADLYIKENLPIYIFEDVAYKEKSPVPIIEESQKLAVAELLVRSGKRVLVRDRPIIINEVRKAFGRMFEYEIIDE